MRELLDSHGVAVNDVLVLLLQFRHSRSTCARRALVTRHVDAFDVRDILQRLQNHHHHNSGAVGVGNDAARTVEGVLGVTFRHYERHVLVHTERARIVNHHRAVLGDVGGKLLGSACARRSKGDVNALEVVVVLEQLHFVLLAPECIFGAGTALRAKKHQLVNRKIPFREDAQELLSYRATRTYNGYFHFNCIDVNMFQGAKIILF